MIDLNNVEHHPAINEIVEVLCNKTQNTDKGFFRTVVAYFLGKVASKMRASVVTKDRGEIPINVYALALASSGFGKGHSVNIMENDFLGKFKNRFMGETMPEIAEKNLIEIANYRALSQGEDQEEMLDKVKAEYNRAGAYPYTFDSGTAPAVKQLRHKLLMAGIGSINLQIDEIGSNLINSIEVLNLFLELYDQGMVKQKLTKNTNENIRGEELDGKTPTNMLLFGTPTKLLDGSTTEDQFFSFLDTGYARRCIFGIGHINNKAFHSLTPEEIYHNLINPSNNASIDKWSDIFYQLADPDKFNWKVFVEDKVAIKLLEYRILCEKAAEALPEHEEIKKAELSHRYFKALKLAGAFAFVDQCSEMEMDHLLQAIKLVEESGEDFQKILNREQAYKKLAKYIASAGVELTHADLVEALPYYKQGTSARNELMALAIAWGYKQRILIKKNFVDGIEFFKGETLKETNLNELIVSYSKHWAENYENELAPFDQLHNLTQAQDFHWVNHHLKNNYRAEENVIPGFNLVVLDVDGDIQIPIVQDLMKEYKYLLYTTKSHTKKEHRFRMILPINYILELDSDDFKEFMSNIYNWLPFKVSDTVTYRSKKWRTHDLGSYVYNLEGETLDALKFIPKTSKNEQYRQELQKIESYDNLERWFAQRISIGNRNNEILKFALALVDSGLSQIEVGKRVHAFNSKLANPLRVDEINSTILRTVAKKYQKP